MKKHIIHFFIMITALLVIVSCNKDFLERPPLSNLTAGTFFNNDAELAASTGALYNIVWAGANGQSLLSFGDGRGGNFFTPYVADWFQFCMFSVSNTNGALKDSWSSFYNVVAQANVTIYNINAYSKPAVSATAKRTALAEARFMRGVAYSYLVQNWGPVPIITDNVKQGGDTTLAPNTVESVWEFAIRDIQYAVHNLPETTVAGRLNKYSAEGMLARFYLTRAGLNGGGNRDQTYLDSAKYYAGDVIHNSSYALMDNYADLFLTANNNNSEQLFGLEWVPLRDPWGVGNGFQSQFAENSTLTGGTDGWGGGHGASLDYILNLDPLDSIRRKATFMFPGDHYPELNKKGGGWTEPEPDTTNNNSNTAHFKKYIVGTPDDNGGKGQVQATGNNTYIQRLADVYFIYAEAIMGNNTSTSDAEALKYYNAVRQRAKLPAVTSFTFDDLLHERRYEFAVEGDAWYDLVRLYYYNPQKAMDIVNSQNKSDYQIAYRNSVVGGHHVHTYRVYTDTTKPRFATVNAATMFLPYPDTEAALAPNLHLDPVPYKFD